MKKILLATWAIFFFAAYAATGETLNQMLADAVAPVYEDDISRKVIAERLAIFESRCKALLAEYNTQEQQAKIYSKLANTYTQSGQVRPDKTIEYIEKTLECISDPVRRTQLYVYWGDAIQVAHAGVRGQELAVARKKAVMPYLIGLKETLQHALPEEKPEMPKVGFLSYDGSTDADKYRKLKREHDAQIEAQRIARFQQDMIQNRDTLTGQVAHLYSRMPFATEEIRSLASKILEDENAVRLLMTAVEKAVQQRAMKFAGRDVNPREMLEDLWEEDKTVAVAKVPEQPSQNQAPSPGDSIAQAKPVDDIQPASQSGASARVWLFLLLVCGIGSIAVLYIAIRKRKRTKASS